MDTFFSQKKEDGAAPILALKTANTTPSTGTGLELLELPLPRPEPAGHLRWLTAPLRWWWGLMLRYLGQPGLVR